MLKVCNSSVTRRNYGRFQFQNKFLSLNKLWSFFFSFHLNRTLWKHIPFDFVLGWVSLSIIKDIRFRRFYFANGTARFLLFSLFGAILKPEDITTGSPIFGIFILLNWLRGEGWGDSYTHTVDYGILEFVLWSISKTKSKRFARMPNNVFFSKNSIKNGQIEHFNERGGVLAWSLTIWPPCP